MYDFAFINLCLNSLHLMQRCSFGPIIIQIGTTNKPPPPTTTTYHQWSTILPRFLHCMKILFSYDTSTYLPENRQTCRILSALYLRLLDLDY